MNYDAVAKDILTLAGGPGMWRILHTALPGLG